MAVISIFLSLVALGFSIWTWWRSQVTTRWDRWREKLSAAFRDDARFANHLAGKEPETPLFVELEPMKREFPKTAEVLSHLPKSLRDGWVSILTEAISFAGSDGVLWWEVHLYTARDEHWKERVPPLRLIGKGVKKFRPV